MWKLFAIAFTLATVVYGQTTRRVTTFADEVESAVFRTYLVSELPSSGQAGKPFVVTDALVTSSGATGGGTKRILCSWNGSAWVPFDSGAASYTPAGTVAAPTFTGSASTVAAQTFTGAQGTVPAQTFTGTQGTVPAQTFTGTQATLTGSVAAPVFTGTQFDNRPSFIRVIFCQKD